MIDLIKLTYVYVTSLVALYIFYEFSIIIMCYLLGIILCSSFVPDVVIIIYKILYDDFD